MQADQNVRRWFNRARRAVIGRVDHEPIVEIEPAPDEPRPMTSQAAQPQSRMRRAAARWSRTAAAFVATLAVFGMIYGVSVAWRERVVLPLDPPAIAAPETGSKAIAAAAMLLALDRIDPARQDWFVPEARQRRAAQMQAGAAEAVAAFIEVVERRRPGRDKDLSIATAALAGATSAQTFADARDALRRFNTRAGKKGPTLDRGRQALAAFARAAEAGVAGHQRGLLAVAASAKAGPISAEGEGEFYRARGYVYAWRTLLGAYEDDLGPKRRAELNGPIQAARAGLEPAASYEPLFQVRSLYSKSGPLTALETRVAASAAALRAFSASLEAPPPR